MVYTLVITTACFNTKTVDSKLSRSYSCYKKMYSQFSLLYIILLLSVSSYRLAKYIASTDSIPNTSARGHQSELKRNLPQSLIRDLECAANDDGPPWMKCVNNTNKTSSECQCRNFNFYDGIVTCDKDSGRLSVLDCNCVTYDNATGQNTIVAGSCFENCMHISKKLYDGRCLQLDDENNRI